MLQLTDPNLLTMATIGMTMPTIAAAELGALAMRAPAAVAV